MGDNERDALRETVRRAFMGDAQAKVDLVLLNSPRAMAKDFSQFGIVRPRENAGNLELHLFEIGDDDISRWTSEPIDSVDVERMLEQISDAPARPRPARNPLQDEFLGMVTPWAPDQHEHWWGAKVPLGQALIDVIFMLPAGVQDPSALLASTATFVREFPQHDETARSYASEQLLALWNSEWRPDSELPLSSEDFVSGITLKSVGVFVDRTFEFRYTSTSAFADHLIYVEMSPTGTPTGASI